MNVLIVLIAILALAYLTETLVEFGFETVAHWIVAFIPGAEPLLFPPKDKPTHLRTGVIQIVAVIVGVAGSFLFQFDVLYLLAKFLNESLKPTEPVMLPISALGMILTGIGIGKGSNYLHEMFKKFFRSKAPGEYLPQ